MSDLIESYRRAVEKLLVLTSNVPDGTVLNHVSRYHVDKPHILSPRMGSRRESPYPLRMPFICPLNAPLNGFIEWV